VNVGSSRRKVYQQVIQRSPVTVGDQLLQGVGSHGSPPDQSTFGGHEKADGEKFHAEFLHWNDQVAAPFFSGLRPHIFGAKHFRDGRAENIGIDQSHRSSGIGKGHRQVDGNGRFTHSSLSGSYGEDVFHTGKQRPFHVVDVFHGNVALDFCLSPQITGNCLLT